MTILPEQFIIFDLETTGLSPIEDEIIEIGAIKVNRDSKDHPTFRILINPKAKIPPKITEITSITQDMVDKEGDPIESALPQFLEFIGDLRLVAYNASFDMGFLKSAAKKLGIPLTNKSSCALKMSRRAWPGLPNYKLATVAEMRGLSIDGAHRALKDCELTLAVYAAAVAELGAIS